MSNTSDEYELRLVANDQAATVVDKLAGKVEDLTDSKHEVEVTADTGDAEKEVKSLDKLLDGLSDDQRAIVLKAKADQAEAEIKRIDRGIAGLTDRSELEIRLQARDDATARLEEVQRLRNDLDGETVDIKVDVSGNAAQRLDDTAAAADRAQRGIGTVRGVTDELGGAATQVGTYGNAVIDAGESVQIFSKQLGLSQEQADKLSGALGAAGIAGTLAITGLVLAWQAYNEKQEETRQKTEAASKSIVDQLGILDSIGETVTRAADEYGAASEIFSKALITDEGDYQRTLRALGTIGLSAKDLGRIMIDLEGNSERALGALAREVGVPDQLADGLARAVDIGEDWNDIRQNLISDGWSDAQIAQYKDIALALEELNDQQQNYDTEEASRQALAIARADERSRALVDQAEAQLEANGATATATEIFDAYLQAQKAAGEETAVLAAQYAQMEAGVRAAGNATATADGQIDGITTAVDLAAKAAENLDKKWSILKGTISDEQAYLNIQDQFAGYLQSLQDIDAEVAAGTLTQEEADRKKRQSLLELEGATASYLEEVLKIPPERATNIIALLDEGKVLEAYAEIDRLTQPRDVSVRIKVSNSGEVSAILGGGRVAAYGGGYALAGSTGETNELGRHEMFRDLSGRTWFLPGSDGQISPLVPAAGAAGVTNVFTAGMSPRRVARTYATAQRRGFSTRTAIR